MVVYGDACGIMERPEDFVMVKPKNTSAPQVRDFGEEYGKCVAPFKVCMKQAKQVQS